MLPPPNFLSELVTRHDPQLVMETICSNRTRAWELLAELVVAPHDTAVQRVADGDWAEDMRDIVEWLEENWNPPALLALRASARGLARDDVADLMGVDGSPAAGLAATTSALVESCREELAAWRDERHDEAKQIRVDQLQLVAIESPLRAHVVALQSSDSTFLSAVGQVFAAYLKLETGR